ncbi:MAG: hypothetical protein ACPH9O_00325 [Akkermansiaceae bacterium]
MMLLLTCTSLHARVGLNIDNLQKTLKQEGGINLPVNNKPEDSSDINKVRCSINLGDRGKWLIEATAWASTGIVHEMSYTKQDGFIPDNMLQQIITGNRELNAWDPVFEPNEDKPVTITIRSKQLDELLEFKKEWSAMGLTLKELEQRFGPGKLENTGQVPPKYLFEKFDPVHNINWSITVDLWQDVDDNEPVAHQIYYERKTKFSNQELEWLREINSKGWKWSAAGAKPPWLNYKTVIPVMPGKKPDLVARPELRAGVKHMDPRKFEAPLIVVYSLNYYLRPARTVTLEQKDEKAEESDQSLLPFLK